MAKTILTNQTKQLGTELINMFLRFIFVGALFVVNFLALSISLQCNRDKGAFQKIFVGLYAFLFGFIYLFVNYYSYRVMTLGEPCQIDTNEIFPL
jgi:hypothetical protein